MGIVRKRKTRCEKSSTNVVKDMSLLDSRGVGSFFFTLLADRPKVVDRVQDMGFLLAVVTMIVDR